ncbi:MAG: hypothetical protein IT374_10865 [Polyangiaceae bacterium]|nr:hypothetical protein [Polyangiaceae bacterium]
MSARVIAAAAALAALGVTLDARADGMTPDWRRADRRLRESPQSFAFEARIGPYRPQIDEEFSGGARPYEQTFGDGRGLYFGFELDWQALRIPHLGTLGPGVSWGYSRRSAVAKVAEGPLAGQDSAQSTYLTIMPMYASAVLRVDMLSRDLGVPLVPYGKLGLGLGLWRASTDNGLSTAPDGTVGKGRTWGTHMALGGMFLLDFLDPSAALGFDEELGVNNSYLFAEWQWLNLDGQVVEKGPQMHVGATGWIAGLALEF